MAVSTVGTAASQEKLGSLHDKITDLMIKKLEAIEEHLENWVDDNGNKANAMNIINLTELNPIVNWLHKNEIGPSIAARKLDGEKTPLQRQLEEAKKKAAQARQRAGGGDADVPGVMDE